jgi:N-acyl amino acid synthase of PEP-CTERM/exosortase system
LQAVPNTTLRDSFRRWFEIVPAVTESLKDEAYRLRHSVYCEDLGFEPPSSDFREVDEFDANSSHLLIRHLSTGEFVGCVRLVRLPPGSPLERLPLERTCGGKLAAGAIPADASARQHIAEVSRLAIARTFRRRRGEAKQAAPLSDESFQAGPIARFPYPLTGLYLGVIATASLEGLTKLFVLTEPRLAHHLGKLGLPIAQIGPPLEHRGLRVPSMIEVEPVVSEMGRIWKPFYDHILESVRPATASSTV